ncbi:MAG: hypothetical protein IJ383_02615 [Bacteroidales bacterium]|nr:hypothetical protein [Bacteroidales bacterium]
MLRRFIDRAAAAALLFSTIAGFQAIAQENAAVAYSSPQEYKSLLAEHQKVYQYPSQEKVDRIVDSVFRKLSTREKIAQIMIIEFDSQDGSRRKAMQNRLVKKEKIGGLIPMNDDLVPAIRRMNELNRLSRIPMLISIDAEWGANMRYWDEIPPFPRQMQLGALSSDSLVYRMGYLLGKECRLLKMQVNYAPDIDINNNPSNPAINTRSFGEDKEKVARYGIAIMQGMKDAGVAGSAKHFPGHGDTDVDSHLALPVIPFDYQRLDTLEMYPFKHLVAAGVDMVMVAHLNVPALDPSGTPSSISRKIVTELLRDKLGFKGIICTDALNMHGVAKESGLEKKDIPLAAYKAGADILLMPEDVENSITVIEQALKRGEITMAGLNERVKKMLALKARLGLFEKGYSPLVEMNGLEQRVIVQENLDLMQQIAKNSMTVLFNDNSQGFGLPVSFKGKKVAYVGYKNPVLGREFAAVANKYGQVDTIILEDDASLAALRDARNRLRDHDLVIFGFNQTDQRPHKGYAINPENISFITEWAKEQPMIAVYLGSPYALTRIPNYRNFTAFVLGYSNNQANNFAAAQVVFGGIPAIGVLPVTAASFKVGESVVIPDRFREELFHFIGSEGDSIQQVKFDLGEASPLLSVVPQAAELVASGKIRESDTLGELLEVEGTDSNLTVGELFTPASARKHIYYMHALISKYRNYVSAESFVQNMLRKLGMRHTAFNGKSVAVAGYSLQDIITSREDLAKFIFAAHNGGLYAGERVFSPYTAGLILKLKDSYLK